MRDGSHWEEEDWKALSVYPNPANEFTTIEYHLRRATSSTITILDAQSKPVYSKSLNKAHGQFIVPLERLATGNYICVFKAGDEVLAKEKLSIVR